MKKYFLAILLLIIALPGWAQPEYKDVAPVFYSRCTSCHHAGGAGGFSLTSYTETASLSGLIENALLTGKMPPWSPDTSYNHFFGERIITASEKNTILSWITANTPAGDTTLAPPVPTYGTYQLNGVPSLELQIPTFTSNATSADSYVCFSLPSGLTQDRYLRAFEIVPGNPAIVHHVIINIDTVGNTTSNLSGNCYTPPGNYSIGAFAPGAPPTVLPGQAPMKLGMRIKAGSKIVLQMHYPAGSAGQLDSTKIRMYFYPLNTSGIRPVVAATPLQNWGLMIPANSITPFTATYQALPIPMTALATFPHSHLLCKSIENYAWSGTDTVKLIRINNWDFEWQGYYTYNRPVKVPAGYQLFSRHVYDNTNQNPNNPHTPPQTITAGLSTTDEMLFDSFLFTTYQTGDELVNIPALLAGDSLLASPTGLYEPASSDYTSHSFAFPNPSSQGFTIQLLGSGWNDQTLVISDLAGRKVFSAQLSATGESGYRATWNGYLPSGQPAPAGLYLYEAISTDGKKAIGRLMVSESR